MHAHLPGAGEPERPGEAGDGGLADPGALREGRDHGLRRELQVAEDDVDEAALGVAAAGLPLVETRDDVDRAVVRRQQARIRGFAHSRAPVSGSKKCRSSEATATLSTSSVRGSCRSRKTARIY